MYGEISRIMSDTLEIKEAPVNIKNTNNKNNYDDHHNVITYYY